jgi:hypothetical protein
MPSAPRPEPRRHRRQPLAVEAEAIDQRLVLGEAEEARRRIARLRPRRHRAGLDEAEAEPQHRVRHLGMLVEAGGESDGIGEFPPPQRDGEARRIGGEGARRQSRGERANGEAMRRLRRQRPQQRQGKIEKCGHIRDASASAAHATRSDFPARSLRFARNDRKACHCEERKQ